MLFIVNVSINYSRVSYLPNLINSFKIEIRLFFLSNGQQLKK